MLLLMTTLGLAVAGSSPSSLDDVLRLSQVVVKGVVSEVESCVSTNEQQAWTFVTVDVDDLLRGTLSDPNNQQYTGDELTLRMPAGDFGDGTMRSFLGLPSLEEDEDVILFLSYGPNGSPLLLPVLGFGRSVYRVVEYDQGETGVVDGNGQVVVYSAGERPVWGPLEPPLRSRYLPDYPFDSDLAESTLADIAEEQRWDGTGVPAGPWNGHVRIEWEDLDDQDYYGSCEARLTGQFNGTNLFATGRCNAGLVGATTLELQGTISGNTWSGTIVGTPDAFPNEDGTWSWSATMTEEDAFSVIDNDTVEVEGDDVYHHIVMYMVFAGPRRMVTGPEFVSWIEDRTDVFDDTEGNGHHLPKSSTSCNFTPALVEDPQ